MRPRTTLRFLYPCTALCTPVSDGRGLAAGRRRPQEAAGGGGNWGQPSRGHRCEGPGSLLPGPGRCLQKLLTLNLPPPTTRWRRVVRHECRVTPVLSPSSLSSGSKPACLEHPLCAGACGPASCLCRGYQGEDGRVPSAPGPGNARLIRLELPSLGVKSSRGSTAPVHKHTQRPLGQVPARAEKERPRGMKGRIPVGVSALALV